MIDGGGTRTSVSRVPEFTDSQDRDLEGLGRLAGWLVISFIVTDRLIADVYTLPLGVSLHATDVILAVLFGVWLLWLITEPRPFPIGMASALGTALLVLILIAPFVNAPEMTIFEANGAERGLVRATLLAGLFVASYHLAFSRSWARRTLIVIVIMTLIQATIAVFEFVTRSPFAILGTLWQSIGLEVDPRGIRGEVLALDQRLTGELRAAATAPHSLVLVGLLAVGMSICLALYLTSESRRARIFLLAAIVFQFVAIGTTNQRTAVVALIAVALVVGLTQFHKLASALPLVAAAGLGAAAVAVVSPNTPRLMLNFLTGQQTDHNVAVRVSKYAVLPDLIEQRPLIGPGYAASDPSQVIFDNSYLTELVELGILGLALLLGFLLVVAFRSLGSLSSAPIADEAMLLSAVLVATVLFATMATFDVLSFSQLFPTCLVVLAVGLSRADAQRRAGRRNE